MNVIQSMWIGPRLTAMEQMCITSYLHYGHPFHLYVYQDTEGIPKGTTVLDANEIVDSSRIFTYEGRGFGRKSYAGFADVFRYRLLLKEGNWWVDTDSICLRPFDFAEDYVFSSEVGNPFHVNCGNLKAPAGSEIYQWLVDKSENVNTQMIWGAIGPSLMRQAVAHFNFHQYVKPPEVFCPVSYDERCGSLLRSYDVWVPSEKNYAVHLWNEAWRSQGLDKDKTYHPDCVYEKLKKRFSIEGDGSPYISLPLPPVPLASKKVLPSPDPKVSRCNRHNVLACAACISRGWQFRQPTDPPPASLPQSPVVPRAMPAPKPPQPNSQVQQAASRALTGPAKPSQGSLYHGRNADNLRKLS
jgi:hypothetical protein